MQGFNEILIIAIVAIILLFGAKKVPEMARAFGRAKGEFERGKQEIDKELKEITKTPGKKEETEREKLIKAANSLGINTQGKTDEQLREEIQAAIKKE